MLTSMTYLMQPPKRYTFEQPQLKRWVETWCVDLTLNLFAGRVHLNVPEFRVDIDETDAPDYCGDAYEFVENYKGKPFGTVILDPPYNIRKAREKYDGRWIGKLTKIKNTLPSILTRNARVISLGHDTVGMSRSRGFRKIGLCVVCHSGDHNDTLIIVEERGK